MLAKLLLAAPSTMIDAIRGINEWRAFSDERHSEHDRGFPAAFCYVPMARDTVDGVAQHRHLSETVSEPSTLDRPAACSAERIFPFFNCL